MEMAAIEAVAELVEIALQMAFVQAMKGALDRGFGVGNDDVKPF